jgi:hypothetical protein
MPYALIGRIAKFKTKEHLSAVPTKAKREG